MIVTAVLIAIGCLVGCAGETGTTLSGVYCNVRFSDETGDASGFELELNVDGPRPTVGFAVCGGGCYGGETWPVEKESNRIAFQITHERVRGDGGPTISDEED